MASETNATTNNGKQSESISLTIIDPEPPQLNVPARHPTERRRPGASSITSSFATGTMISSTVTDGVNSRRSSHNNAVDVENDGSSRNENEHHQLSNQGNVTSSDSQPSASLFFNRLRLFSSQHAKEEANDDSNTKHTKRLAHSNAFRRFGVGDYALITNHDLANTSLKLVNIHGFAEWDAGEALTSEEERGPYIYLLVQVNRVHFRENLPFYTVTRMDNGENQRADVEYMEPITNQRNIEAAKRAALKRYTRSITPGTTNVRNRRLNAMKSRLSRQMYQIHERCGWARRKTQTQLNACLNGNRPYSFTFRLSGVNLLVVCSFWYLFIDQIRLVYAPNSLDDEFAIVSFTVWLILVLELLFEMYIRPPDYSSLIKSEHAYLPSTVRYISNFHIWTELIGLAFFTPEFVCLFNGKSCGSILKLSLTTCCMKALYGPDKLNAFYGQAFLCLMRLRIFGLVRHWEKMWLNNTFVRVKGEDGVWTVKRSRGLLIPRGHLYTKRANDMTISESLLVESTVRSRTNRQFSCHSYDSTENKLESYPDDDIHLTNASKLGTALLTTNAQRALILIFLIGLQALISVLFELNGGTNQQLWTSVELLQSNNIATTTTDNDSCDFFEQTVRDWILENLIEEKIKENQYYLHLISLDIQPVRCQFQIEMGEIVWQELCAPQHAYECTNILSSDGCKEFCAVWPSYSLDERSDYTMRHFGVRPSMTVLSTSSGHGSYSFENGTVVESEFFVKALFNERLSAESSIMSLFILQIGFTLFVLMGLSVLRYDAGRLVLGPLRRMLKIVALYSKNPLALPPKKVSSYNNDNDATDKLGTFETEQLISTVTKITDLLRKCWGVAGAGIISSNLARQENGLSQIAYFNPTVPGKAVYALFAFVAIDNFKSYLHNLEGDIMILINDVAAILHEEVYRWGYEDKGQCNKNLGSAFLMVYKIGAVNEVLENRRKAEQVIFSSTNTPSIRRRFTHNHASSVGLSIPSLHDTRRHSSEHSNCFSTIADNLDLSSLPGIQAFADRALLGLLKTFASIHRDKAILNWNDDFRLRAGVREVSIELFFGMDAGWAVEGAVGSSYKIDATYLSPHVNMASRMMSATKQYGLFLLLSQKVQSLLSLNAQNTLRHIDTVTVKGSSIQQKIFTFDMKVRQDFFLYSKTESQSDLDSQRYSPDTWDNDQDLSAMRNHISDEFLDTFNQGRDEYLSGKDWKKAIELLKLADKIMCKREIEEGYSNSESLDKFDEHRYSLSNIFNRRDSELETDECVQRLAMGDGPCQTLIRYMMEHGGEAPASWAGYKPLTSERLPSLSDRSTIMFHVDGSLHAIVDKGLTLHLAKDIDLKLNSSYCDANRDDTRKDEQPLRLHQFVCTAFRSELNVAENGAGLFIKNGVRVSAHHAILQGSVSLNGEVCKLGRAVLNPADVVSLKLEPRVSSDQLISWYGSAEVAAKLEIEGKNISGRTRDIGKRKGRMMPLIDDDHCNKKSKNNIMTESSLVPAFLQYYRDKLGSLWTLNNEAAMAKHLPLTIRALKPTTSLDTELCKFGFRRVTENDVTLSLCNQLHQTEGQMTLDANATRELLSNTWIMADEDLYQNNALKKQQLGVFLSDARVSGEILQQELNSMLPVSILAAMLNTGIVTEGSNTRFLDLCAAPGSKTCQLLNILDNIMNKSGRVDQASDFTVVANELVPQRANRTRTRCFFQGNTTLSHLIVTTGDGCDYADMVGNYFDFIICDVPCSGDGTIRKSPEKLEKWTAMNGEKNKPLQKQLLRVGLSLLKPIGDGDIGGALFYSTCSLNPVENDEVINEILEELSLNELYKYEIVDLRSLSNVVEPYNKGNFLRVLPAASHGGFFVCALRKLYKSNSVALHNSDFLRSHKSGALTVTREVVYAISSCTQKCCIDLAKVIQQSKIQLVGCGVPVLLKNESQQILQEGCKCLEPYIKDGTCPLTLFSVAETELISHMAADFSQSQFKVLYAEGLLEFIPYNACVVKLYPSSVLLPGKIIYYDSSLRLVTVKFTGRPQIIKRAVRGLQL